MSKHTPGPWEVGEDRDIVWGPEWKGHRVLVANVPFTKETRVEADARLIAAAPELLGKLEALIAAAEYLQARVVETRGANCMDNLDVAIDEARKAIAKANAP